MAVDPYLIKRVMLLSHERGLEIGVEEVLSRANDLVGKLQSKGLPADTIYALELMAQLLDSSHEQ